MSGHALRKMAGQGQARIKSGALNRAFVSKAPDKKPICF
jgi:hypothetical protein